MKGSAGSYAGAVSDPEKFFVYFFTGDCDAIAGPHILLRRRVAGWTWLARKEGVPGAPSSPGATIN